MFEASHLQYNITSGYIQIVSNGHSLPAFWAHPEQGGPFPGLVMLHDVWGLSKHVRAQVRRFAEQGYYVIAPDLFNRQPANSVEDANNLIAKLGEAASAYVTAALNALRTHHRCNGKIGLIGWGLGGRLALQTGVLRDDLRGAVTFYTVPDTTTPAELRMMSTPLLALFGETDPDTPPDKINALRDLLDSADAPHELHTYPGAGRDFFNDMRPNEFNEAAAEDAWNRALSFLNEHLDVPRPADPERPDALPPGAVY